MTLDDLLIYGDWLEENYIKNSLYKQFINILKIRLRKNNQYRPLYIAPVYHNHEDGNGYDKGLSFLLARNFAGNGKGYGIYYGFNNGDGRSI